MIFNSVIISKGGTELWLWCHRVLLERGLITGTRGHIDESVRRGAERKIGRKGLGLWTTHKKQWLSLNKASEDVFMTPRLEERLVQDWKKGRQGCVYLFKVKAFWHRGSTTTWMYLRNGCCLRSGGWKWRVGFLPGAFPVPSRSWRHCSGGEVDAALTCDGRRGEEK